MRKKIIWIVILSLISCDYYYKKLEVVNNTGDTIYYAMILDTTGLKNLPDCPLDKLLPHNSGWPTFPSGRGDINRIWEEFINNNSPDSTLHIYFFDTNTFCDQAFKTKLNKKYDLNLKDLDSLKWRIIYKD